jgi:1-aminocyclopropane-1-carboxylate deaminase
VKQILKVNKFIFLAIISFSNFIIADLFTHFPGLRNNLAHIKFCDLPTPIIKLESFGAFVGYKNIFMKADDLTGKKIDESEKINNGLGHLYGGNKPRKLEFLLADAKKMGKETILTYGCAGSNHALATAVYAKELGFKKCILMLKNQPNSPVVRHNLLLDYYCGAELLFYPDNQTRRLAAEDMMRNDPSIYFIPTGGSNAIGAIGFVNAAFELKEQVEQGCVPAPDLIYIPVGSCGTFAGLLLGLRAVGLESKIVAVAVEPEEIENEFYINTKKIFTRMNELLHSLDPLFNLYEFPEDKFIINKKFEGSQYGLFTPEAVSAIKLFGATEHVKLEGTYSAKPISAIVDDLANGFIKNETVLFWNTYCGIDYSELTKFIDYKNMPPEFQKYFEEDIQPLSKID